MPRNRNQRGQAALLYTLASTTMFGMIGLAADVGWMYFREQAVQSAAEAAAMGGALAALQSSPGGFTCGASGVVCQAATACPNPIPSPPTTNMHNACFYAKDNGFQVTATSKQNVTIAANVTAPPTVTGAAPEYWVTATVTERVPQAFSAVLGNTSGYVSARATAGVIGKAPAQCIYVLDPSNPDVLDASGAAVLSTDCSVQVNSSANGAAQANGSSIIRSGSINVVGTTTVGGTSVFNPVATTHAPVITDPLVNLPAPTYGSTCDHTLYSLGSGNTATIGPGVYCDGMTFNGNSVATLTAGTYIVRGGGLTISNGASVSGSGVTFYITGDLLHPYGGVNFSGGTFSTLSAPTSGQYQGILIYQDRSIITLLGNAISNGANAQLSGAIYFPTTSLSFSGGSSTSIPNTALIVKRLSITGSAYMKYDSTGTLSGLIQRSAAIIE